MTQHGDNGVEPVTGRDAEFPGLLGPEDFEPDYRYMDRVLDVVIERVTRRDVTERGRRGILCDLLVLAIGIAKHRIERRIDAIGDLVGQ